MRSLLRVVVIGNHRAASEELDHVHLVQRPPLRAALVGFRPDLELVFPRVLPRAMLRLPHRSGTRAVGAVRDSGGPDAILVFRNLFRLHVVVVDIRMMNGVLEVGDPVDLDGLVGDVFYVSAEGRHAIGTPFVDGTLRLRVAGLADVGRS